MRNYQTQAQKNREIAEKQQQEQLEPKESLMEKIYSLGTLTLLDDWTTHEKTMQALYARKRRVEVEMI